MDNDKSPCPNHAPVHTVYGILPSWCRSRHMGLDETIGYVTSFEGGMAV